VRGYGLDEVEDDLAGTRRAPAIALAAGVCVFLAAWLSLFDLLTLDTRLTALTVGWAGTAPPAADTPAAVLLAIDEKTVAAVGRPFDRSWRREHAQVVAQAASAGATALAFDVVMEAGSPDDAAFAQAAAAAHARTPQGMPVIVGVQGRGDGAPAIAPAIAPQVGFGLACAGKRLGAVALMPLAAQRASEAAWPSLALAAFSAGDAVQAVDRATRQVRLESQPLGPGAGIGYFADEPVRSPQAECPALAKGDLVASQWVAAAAAQGGAVRHVPYEAVLRGDAAALRVLAGRAAVVGVTLKGEDVFRVAGNDGAVAFGSELIVAQLQGLADGRAVRPLGGVALWLLMTGLAFAGAQLAIALRRRPPWLRRAAWAGAVVLVAAASLAWFGSEMQVVPLHHAIGALALGGYATCWLARRGRKGGTAALAAAGAAT